MWFAVLGPLSVHHEGTEKSVPAGKLRTLLAVLLVHANEVRSFDALGEALWDGAPPPAARATIRNHVKRLRQVLGPEAGARIITRDPGYLIELADGELDLLRLNLMFKEAATAMQAHEWPRAATVLEEAAGLWRGTPFVDVLSPVLHRDEVPRLEQLRLQMVEWRIDTDLHLGRHARVVLELRAMASECPLRERVHEQLLLALAACGRRAEALDAYQQARRTFVDELGIEPGPTLRQLHQRILTDDPALAVTPALDPIITGGDKPPEPVSREVSPSSTRRPGRDLTGTIKRHRSTAWSRANVRIAAMLGASLAVLATAATFAMTADSHPASHFASRPALYNRCPVGEFCLFNGKDASTSYCTWTTSDPIADQNCAWLKHGWKVRSVFNHTATTVEYCAQEHYQGCLGLTPPDGWGNLPGTYTVRSVKSE